MVKSIVASYESQEKNGHNFRFFINLRRKLSSENFCRTVPGGAVRDDLDHLADGVERVPSRLGLAEVGGEVGRQAGGLVGQGVEVTEDLLDRRAGPDVPGPPPARWGGSCR